VDPTRQFTRAFDRVESVQVEPGPDGRDRVLRVQHGRGSTAMVFE
jgi:hypothetical protein